MTPWDHGTYHFGNLLLVLNGCQKEIDKFHEYVTFNNEFYQIDACLDLLYPQGELGRAIASNSYNNYSCRCGDNVNKYSWEVELVKDPSTIQEPYCRGTLISEKEIVTAAHCGETSWVRLQAGNVPAKVDISDLLISCG